MDISQVKKNNIPVVPHSWLEFILLLPNANKRCGGNPQLPIKSKEDL